jgi:DNA-binding transcriptional MerR regulator
MDYYTMAEVVRRLKTIPRHKITFALDRGFIPEPAKISGRRMFTAQDIEVIQLYFSKKEGASNEPK